MRNASIVLGTTIALALAAVSYAQRPAGITPEMIATALPVEGAPLAVPGPYKVESGPAFGSPGHVVYRPSDLTPFPARDTMPVMVWGNGGCAINSTRYAGFLTTIASHGFLVMATAAEPGAAGGRATADNLRKAVDWAEAENKRAGSPLTGKIALDRVAIMGQSCGGFLSLELGADPRVDTIGVFNSGLQGNNTAQLDRAARSGAAHQRARAGLLDGVLQGDLRRASRRCRPFTARVTAPGTRRQSIILVAASSRTSPRTGFGGSSRATSRPRRCSWARTAASVRTRTGTRRRSGCSSFRSRIMMA